MCYPIRCRPCRHTRGRRDWTRSSYDVDERQIGFSHRRGLGASPLRYRVRPLPRPPPLHDGICVVILSDFRLIIISSSPGHRPGLVRASRPGGSIGNHHGGPVQRWSRRDQRAGIRREPEVRHPADQCRRGQRCGSGAGVPGARPRVWRSSRVLQQRGYRRARQVALGRRREP